MRYTFSMTMIPLRPFSHRKWNYWENFFQNLQSKPMTLSLFVIWLLIPISVVSLVSSGAKCIVYDYRNAYTTKHCPMLDKIFKPADMYAPTHAIYSTGMYIHLFMYSSGGMTYYNKPVKYKCFRWNHWNINNHRAQLCLYLLASAFLSSRYLKIFTLK